MTDPAEHIEATCSRIQTFLRLRLRITNLLNFNPHVAEPLCVCVYTLCLNWNKRNVCSLVSEAVFHVYFVRRPVMGHLLKEPTPAGSYVIAATCLYNYSVSYVKLRAIICIVFVNFN